MKQHIANALSFLAKWRRSGRSEIISDTPVLLPLTPKYDSTKHGVYFDVIQAALTDREKRARNIALTGSYGVGKSSILTEVAMRHGKRVITVSLSTLGFPEEERVNPEGSAGAASMKTNRIQKEIVKQLLYSQDPLKTPGSRYHRTTRFRFWRALGLAALLAVPITGLFLLTDWTGTLFTLIPLTEDPPWLPHLIVFASLALLIVGFLAAFHNRFQIEKLGTGAATISLSARSATYFDEYLDEIVYFFEVIKRDIVIFEDIDRFDDAHIFETLRSLNSILNGAKQLKGRKIRFIYAIKDSIFEELGSRASGQEHPEAREVAQTSVSILRSQAYDAAEVEVARANRTKFFDLVIPVVPFITHRSARDLLVQTMKQDLSHRISDELIDLAARHVADMRLVKNIRNEYAIFKRQVIELGNLNLSEDGLFAMVLYKSTHLADFELIKLGKSNLDALYHDGRDLVADNLSRLRGVAGHSRRRRIPLGTAHAKSLGDSLEAHVTRTLASMGISSIQSFSLDGEALTIEDLRSLKFWEKLATSGSAFRVICHDPRVGTRQADFTIEHLRAELREELNSAEWVESEQKRLDQITANANKDREFLSHADMSDLMARDDFKFEVDGAALSFQELAKKRLGSELAIRLLEAGFIDRNFTLYTSTFHTDRVSANATNFILKNVDPNIVDMHFPLTNEDVESVVRERGHWFLRERSAYNTSILDYLLAADPQGETLLLEALAKGGPLELEFMLVYIEGGALREEFIRALAPLWPRIFTFLMADLETDEDVRKTLIDAALQSTTPGIDYSLDDEVREYLINTYETLDTFTSDRTDAATASEAARIADQAGVKIPMLEALAPTVRSAIVSGGGFVVDRNNLLSALGHEAHPLSLDAIALTNPTVYTRVLADLPAYFAALGETQPTIANPAAFLSTISDVIGAGQEHLPMTIRGAAPACIVDVLSEVSSISWVSLAEYGRFPATFYNVSLYEAGFGVDSRLARLLEAVDEIAVEADDTDASRHALALKLISARAEIASAEHRATLVASLELENYIASNLITAEPGELIGWLIAKDVIGDDPTATAAVEAGDWEGLAFAINKSTAFAAYMTTTEVTPANVARMLRHDLVPTEVKEAILARFSEFTIGTDLASLQSIAQHAARVGATLAIDEIARLAREGVDAPNVVTLLMKHLGSLTMAELTPVLLSLGGEYAKLSARSGKRPRLARTPGNRALVNRLTNLGFVSSDTESGNEIKVNMRQP